MGRNLIKIPVAILPSAFIILFSSLFVIMPKLISDADTGWHIMAGKYILANGIPKYDPFSFTAGVSQWYNLSWLWDVIFAGIYNAGGLYYICLATVLIVVFTLILQIKLAIEQSNLIAGIVAVAILSTSLLENVLARPHQLSLLFFLVFYYLIYNFSENKFSWRALALLPFLMILWVNIHGSFLAAFTLFAAFAFRFLWQKQFRKLKQLAIIGIICVTAIFINPLGIKIITGIQQTIHGQLINLVREWQPVTNIPTIISLIFFTAMLLITIKKQKLANMILSFFWLGQAIVSARYLPFFAIVATPALATAVHHFIGRSNFLKKKNKEYNSDFARRNAARVAYILSGALVLASLLPATEKILFGENGLKLSVQDYPKEEIDFILANYSGARLLNFYDYGGYIIYLSDGQMKTFIDGRAETVFPVELVNDYLDFTRMAGDWQKLPDKYQIEVILWPKELPQAEILEKSGWKAIFVGNKAVILARTDKRVFNIIP